MMRPVALLVTASFFLTQAQAQIRAVLVEVKTATWCPACPAADVFAGYLIANHPGDVLVVAVHADDPMLAMGGSYADALDISGVPFANFDRTENSVGLGQWYLSVNSRLNETPPAEVSATRTYDAATRQLSVTVSAHFLTSLPSGDYRFSGIVVEDGVTGTSSGYSQQNMYSGTGQPMGGYEDLPDPVPAASMVYDHVAREILGGYNGLAGSLPASPQAGQTYSHAFTYTIPQTYNDETVRVYGVLTNANTGEVLNAGASPYAADNFNDPPAFVSNDSLHVLIGEPMELEIVTYDADLEQMQIEAVSGLPSWANLEMENGHEAMLSGTPTQAGTFNITLQATDGITTTDQQLVLRVDGIYDPWTPLGTSLFTGDGAESHISAAVEAATGKVHMAYTGEDSKVKVYKWNGSVWAQVGNQMTANDNNAYVDVAIHPVLGRPWIRLPGRGHQHQGDEVGWEPLDAGRGSDPGSTSQDIAITNDGTPYLANCLGGTGLLIHQWNGTAWTSLGGNSPIAIADVDEVGWPRMAITSNNEPIVAFRGHNAVTNDHHIYVGRWNGSTWDVLGEASPSVLNVESSIESHHIATGSNGEIHVAIAHATGIDVYSFNGNSWDLIGEHDIATPCSFDLLAGSEGVIMPYTTTFARLSCKTFEGSSWSSWGDDFTPEIEHGYFSAFLLPNGDPCVVYADDNNWWKVSAERLMVGSIGIEATDAGIPSVHAFPNPTSGRLYIAGHGQARKQVIIMDASGRIVARTRMASGYIDVPELERGSYVIQFPEEGTSMKFVKE